MSRGCGATATDDVTPNRLAGVGFSRPERAEARRDRAFTREELKMKRHCQTKPDSGFPRIVQSTGIGEGVPWMQYRSDP